MATAVRTEASLAFIGLGLAPPTPTWGGMVRDGFESILGSFYLALFPSMAILLLVLAFNLIGDGLRDAIDPRLKDAS
jgi:peptide/nickel transport system permease protein